MAGSTAKRTSSTTPAGSSDSPPARRAASGPRSTGRRSTPSSGRGGCGRRGWRRSSAPRRTAAGMPPTLGRRRPLCPKTSRWRWRPAPPQPSFSRLSTARTGTRSSTGCRTPRSRKPGRAGSRSSSRCWPSIRRSTPDLAARRARGAYLRECHRPGSGARCRTGRRAWQRENRRTAPRPRSRHSPRRTTSQALARHRARRPGCWPGQAARTLAFSRSNSSAEMTPRSRRPASFASWSAVLAGALAAVSWA